ncbi:MAG: hypothetical protein K0R10_393 [Alphaproteobacteria bacterium]|jgi:uncharacterized protein YicC (UPF0701 family)|nr:hypothetical protein [Alphaproteobacteria bacterium]
MTALGPFTAQTTLISLLKTGAANVSAAKKQSPQNALLDHLEKADPEKTRDLRKQYQESQDLLQRLQSSRSSLAEQRKADAAEKIKQIKEKLAMLRMLAAVNPEAAARQAAQLANELKQAVRDYGSAGGGASPSVAPSTAQTADAAAQAGGTEQPAAATPETVRQALDDIKKQREAEGAALRDKIQQQGSALAVDAQKRRADSEFVQAAKDAREDLKRILEAAKRRLQEKGVANNRDITAGNNTLRDAVSAIQHVAAAATSGAPPAVNILA